MNLKKAKALRKRIYGQGSKRNEYTYVQTSAGVILCKGKRGYYQHTKKEVSK